MGGQCSKGSKTNEDPSPSSSKGSKNMEDPSPSSSKGSQAIEPSPSNSTMNPNHHMSAALTSYEDACKTDPELQAFDATLHEKTNRVINSLATTVEVRSLSFDSLKEVTSCLLDMNQEVVKVILDCKRDVWKDDDLFDLVEEYFDNSIKTIDFCAVLENCLKQARNSQFLVQVAVKQFEQECPLQVGFAKTLHELRMFKDAENPFTEEFFNLFQLVYRQQISMLEKLQRRKTKLDKKIKTMKKWRMVTNVLFVSAFVSVLVFSVVAAAIAAPPVITALAGALTVPIGSIGKWCNNLWNKYMQALKGQKELVGIMQVGTFITIKDMDTIRVLVGKLEVEIEGLVQNAEFALQDEGEVAVKLVIDEIKKKLDMFNETIDALAEHTRKCSRDISQARTVILQRIIRYPGQ